MPTTKAQLQQTIKDAFDTESDAEITPAAARARIANKIAAAVEAFVIGRQTIVTGASSDGASVTGTGIIQ